MLAVVVFLVIGFIAYVAGSKGEWGVVAVTAVIGICVLIGVYGMRREDKAFWNHINGGNGSGQNRRQQSARPRNVKLKKGQSLEDAIRELNRRR